MLRRFSWRVLCALIGLFMPLAAHAAGDVWDANGAMPPDGIWGTGANWADNTTPGNSDTATFNLAGTYTVTFNANPLAIQGLTVSDGDVTFTSSGGPRTLSVSTSFTPEVLLDAGNLTLGTSGNPLHLNADGLTVQNGSTLNVNAGGLTMIPADAAGLNQIIVSSIRSLSLAQPLNLPYSSRSLVSDRHFWSIRPKGTSGTTRPVCLHLLQQLRSPMAPQACSLKNPAPPIVNA